MLTVLCKSNYHKTRCMTCRAALEPPKTTVDGISPAAETTADSHYDYIAEKKNSCDTTV